MANVTAARFRVVSDAPPRRADPSAELVQLCRALGSIALQAEPASPGTSAASLLEIALRARRLLHAVEQLDRSAAMHDACAVARLGLSEAEDSLARAAESSGELRVTSANLQALRSARLKSYLALMTMRQTRVHVEMVRAPFWQTLSPLLSARRAIAEFRAALTRLSDGESVDAAWRLFVADAELTLLLLHPALAELDADARASLLDVQQTLIEPHDTGAPLPQRFGRGKDVCEALLTELSGRAELRQTDLFTLRALTRLMAGDRSAASFGDELRSSLFALHGLDAEIDRIIGEVDDGASTPWARLLVRATELLSDRFDEVWQSGAPPRLR